VGTWGFSRPAHRGGASNLPSRRPRRLTLHCESLELRQLLSVGQVGSANPASSQVVAQPALPVAVFAQGGNPTGLSPSQIQSAYGVNQINFGSVSGTGAGQTIAIIDSYYDPNISSDLAKFDSQFGLTAPPSFTQYVESGLFFDNSGWALETALDVEWAHAIAPAANIVLVEAQPDLTDLFSAVSFASQLSGVSVVSMSWGAGEFSGEAGYDNVFTTPAGHNGVTFVASSGDSGTTEYPSTSPNVLSVGGTTLNIAKNGSISETGWSGSGTGYSPYESEPSWQTSAISNNGLKSGARTTPDVAWDANPSTGVSVYDSVPYGRQSGWFTVGGTSVGAPSWAGLIAIADQGLALNRVGSLSNAQISLYKLPSSNFNQPTGGSSSAATYSLVTGLGSPKANLLIPALVKLNSPAATPATQSPAATPTGSKVSAHGASLLSPSQTNPTTTGGDSSSSSSSSSSTTTISITPLNPSLTATPAPGSLTPVFVVPPPLPAPVIHLGPSVSPVTEQAVFSPLSAQDELPTSLTHFGQAFETELQRFLKARLSPKADATPLIDVVEPFQPLGPAEAPRGEPAPTPVTRGAWLSRLLAEPGVGGVLALTDRNQLPGAFGGRSAYAKDWRDATPPSWGLSTLFGATAVAAGGYHLAIREADRFRRRWLRRRP
jgi:hypothetical protein